MELLELEQKVTDLEKQVSDLAETVKKLEGKVTPEVKKEVPVKKLVTPDTKIKVGDGTYQFTAPNFNHKRKLYVTEEIVANLKDNTALLAELVKNQTHDLEGFQDGLLKKVS